MNQKVSMEDMSHCLWVKYFPDQWSGVLEELYRLDLPMFDWTKASLGSKTRQQLDKALALHGRS